MGMMLHRRDVVSQEKGPIAITRSLSGCAFVLAEKTATSYLSCSPVVNICLSFAKATKSLAITLRTRMVTTTTVPR